MADLLEIKELGNSILREETLEVKNPKDPRIQKLIDDMMVTMEDANGVGIAAPQVDENLQILLKIFTFYCSMMIIFLYFKSLH